MSVKDMAGIDQTIAELISGLRLQDMLISDHPAVITGLQHPVTDSNMRLNML